ncbi:MAG TPA: hypothetical protein IAB32_02290 [Candidatus Scatosoma pullicola]|nr:hypothetical protein [Candidatus Scatosoma pullicola]
MAKKIFGLFVAGLLAASAAVVSACGPIETDSGSDSGTSAGSEEEIVLSGFDVPEEATVSYGTIYTIPDYVVQDQNGTLYTVEYVVTSGGETVSVVGGQISIDSMEDYTITYTVQIDEDDMVQKTTVLKVMDENIPYVSMSGMRLSYLVGETIALPTVEVTDNLDTGLTAALSVMQGDEVVIESVTEAFSIDTRGAYTIVATATDSAGNVGRAEADFVVRDLPAKGEVEDFADEYAAYSVSPKGNYGEILTGETAEIEGETAYKITSADTTGANTKYPGLSLAPRTSLDEVKALKEAGFDAVTMEIYLESPVARTLYHQWAYNTDDQGNPTTHRQTNLGSVQNNAWTTVTFDLDLFIGAYDDIASGEILLFYFGNDSDWVTQVEFNYYVKDIYVTRTLTDIAVTENLEDTYALDASVDISGVSAASESAPDAQFDISVIGPAGEELLPEGGAVSAADYGVYTVSVSVAEESKCYLGGTEFTFTVLPPAEIVEETVEGIMTAADMTDAGIVRDAALLRNWLEILDGVEGSADFDMFRYYAAMNLTNDAAIREESNKLMYFDTGLGREQVTTSYNTNTPLTSKNGITLDTETTYDGSPTTKIEFTDVPDEWFGPYRMTFSLVAPVEMSDYTQIRFWLKGDSYSATRPMTYFLAYNGDRISEPVILPTGEWVEVVVDLSEVEDLSLLTVAFHTYNDNLYGSVWNEAGRFHVNISAVYGLTPVEDIEISSGFVQEDSYDIGDTIDLSHFSASSETYPEAEFTYTMTFEGVTTELPESITFENPGWYTFTATAAGVYSGSESVTVYVNGTADNPTADEIADTVDAVLAADDKTSEEVREMAALLESWEGMLDGIYGAENLDMFRFYAALNLVDLEEGKVMYFDTAMGKDQVTLEYNRNEPVETKNGLTLDTEMTYNGEPTMKVEFTDVEGWFSPFLINFAYPGESAEGYDYLRFAIRGHSGLMQNNRPLEYAILYNGTRFVQPTVLATDEWTEIVIDLEANNITDLSGLTLAFYSLNGNDIWGSITSENDYFYAHISAVYGIKAVDDIQISDAFEPEVSYGLGATLDLTSFVASSETYPDLAYAYTVEFGGESSEMAGSITFEETGVYTLVATVTTPGYTGSVRVEILVSEEVAPTADYLMQVADDILAADDKTAEEVIAQAEYLASWESVLSNLEGYENMDMFRYYAAVNLLELEEGEIMYFDTAFGKEQITTFYNVDTPLTSKDGITLDTETTYDGKPTTKVEFTDVPDEWFGPYRMTLSLADSSKEYSYLRFWLQGYSYNANRPMTYFLAYDGDRISEPVTLPTGEWVEVLVDLSDIEDIRLLTIAFNTYNNNSGFGSVWNEAGRFHVNITAVYGLKGVTDLKPVDAFSSTVYEVGKAPDLSAFAVTSETYPELTFEYTANGQPLSEVSLSEAGIYEVKAMVTTEGYRGELIWNIFVFDPAAGVCVADAEATISQIVPRGYGTDMPENSYVADFNGRDAIMAETNPQTSSSNGNTYKWPGIDIHTSLSLANLNDLKEMGYTTMIIPVYITDSNVDSLKIRFGPNGPDIVEVAVDQWVEVEISIDAVIERYNSTLNNYFMYIDNGDAVNYITYYIGDITLIAKA